MTRINVYSLRLVKESGAAYDVDKSITNPANAAEVINQVFNMQNQPNEVFAILCLNTKNKVVGAHIISQGSLSSADYIKHVKQKAQEQGQAYYASEEYKKLYPIMRELYKVEGHAARKAAKSRLTRQIKQDTLKYGVPVGLFMS